MDKTQKGRGVDMINSYLIIKLDTTAPILTFNIPTLVNQDELTTFEIFSNEELGSYREVHIIDSMGMRYNLSFHYDSTHNKLVGYLNFNDMALGMASIYIKTEDMVGNVSDLYSHSFNIIASTEFHDNILYRKVSIKKQLNNIYYTTTCRNNVFHKKLKLNNYELKASSINTVKLKTNRKIIYRIRGELIDDQRK